MTVHGGVQDDRINRYSDALELVKRVRGTDDVRAFVQRSVLKAYRGPLPPRAVNRPLSEGRFSALEKDVGNWRLPDGLRALAAVIKAYPAHVCQTMLTTNFDGLLEIALRAAGVRAYTFAAQYDGTMAGLRLDPEEHLVLHLHGDCRGATLHSPREIGRPRPALEAWLSNHLRQRTLLVIGYSGWDDIVARVLRDELNDVAGEDAESATEILWSVYEDEENHAHINPGLATFFHENSHRVTPYYGIDRDRLFVELQDKLNKNGRTGWVPAGSSTVATTNLYQLARTLSEDYHFGHSAIPRMVEPKFVFWPHRLRKPHLIHGVHALTAVLFGKLGIPIELYLDDIGINPTRADEWASEFEEAVAAWFSVCGSTVRPTMHRLSTLLEGMTESDRAVKLWNLANNFYSPTAQIFDVLVAAKVIDADTPNIAVAHSSAHRLLRPIYTWLALDAELDRYGSAPGDDSLVVTLGGKDEQQMWDLWRTRDDVPAVASVYVPRLETPADGADLWTNQELLRSAVYRERDLVRFIRLALADAGTGESLLEWLYTVAVQLADMASDGAVGRLSVAGRRLRTWYETLPSLRSDPMDTSLAVAHAMSSWFHSDIQG
ncbi:MAG TPA: SIR2 family protein [Pseudonocardiaceae bacterium]|nr:SIR2 family protein [Pseudonocardiaceae bacterium]